MENKKLEAINVLLQAWQGNKDAKGHPDFDDINEALDTIKQDLKRKKILEKENKKLKKAIKILKVSLLLDVYVNSRGEFRLDANDFGIPNLTKRQYKLLKEAFKNDEATN